MVVMAVDGGAVSARPAVERSGGVSPRAAAGRAAMAAARRGGQVLAENGDAMKAKTSMTCDPLVVFEPYTATTVPNRSRPGIHYIFSALHIFTVPSHMCNKSDIGNFY
jgi:hypothetical protein